MQRETLTVKETAAVLGLSEGAVRAAIIRGEIPSTRVGRRILIPRQTILARLIGGTEADARASNDRR